MTLYDFLKACDEPWNTEIQVYVYESYRPADHEIFDGTVREAFDKLGPTEFFKYNVQAWRLEPLNDDSGSYIVIWIW